MNNCNICKIDNSSEEVTNLRCNHVICWMCLQKYVSQRLAPKIKCPISNCNRFIGDASIRKVLTDSEISIYENKMFSNLNEKVKCLYEDCFYFIICPSSQIQFDCPECSLFNCVSCNAAHRYISCEEFRTSEESQERCNEEKERARIFLQQRRRAEKRQMFMDMDEVDVFTHDNVLECNLCDRTLVKEDAIILRCSHLNCKYCLIDHINNSHKFPIPCPQDGCNKTLEEREIFKLIANDDLRIYVDRCNSVVKGKLGFTFQCQTPDCIYFVEYSSKPEKIFCPLCKVNNCTRCYVAHPDETCSQYKERIKNTPAGRAAIEIEGKIARKELMRCLKYHTILNKTRGCNWIQCSNCKFEMCWILQMRRWGPGGRGDNSGGCKCGVGGIYCSPDCLSSCQPHNG